MITITRRQARHLRAVLRRAFGNLRGPGPVLGFIADAEGLRVRAISSDVAVEYHAVSDGHSETLWLPFSFLSDCEGKHDEPVQLEAAGPGRVTAQWRDGSVPQIVRYDAPEPLPQTDTFPQVPETLAENPPQLLRALTDAGDTCDPDSARYALGCVQFRGQDGSIGATDGRQLLVQSGFAFPWQEDLLVPRSRVFASPELATDRPVRVGRADDWVACCAEPWTIWLAINKTGRFPDLSRYLLRDVDITTRCSLSASDAAFLKETLPRLPCDGSGNDPVTVDLNGRVAVRAKGADEARPTEVVLTGSSWSDDAVRLNMNRKYLARAARLGLRELCVHDNQTPVLCQDERRRYVWAVLTPESAIQPAEDAIRIESPSVGNKTPVPKPQVKRRTLPMSEPTVNQEGNSHPQSNGRPQSHGQAKVDGQARNARRASQQDFTRLIEQAEKFRTALHGLLREAGGLVKALKQHRRQNRAVESTLASLRQLKGLGV